MHHRTCIVRKGTNSVAVKHAMKLQCRQLTVFVVREFQFPHSRTTFVQFYVKHIVILLRNGNSTQHRFNCQCIPSYLSLVDSRLGSLAYCISYLCTKCMMHKLD